MIAIVVSDGYHTMIVIVINTVIVVSDCDQYESVIGYHTVIVVSDCDCGQWLWFWV